MQYRQIGEWRSRVTTSTHNASRTLLQVSSLDLCPAVPFGSFLSDVICRPSEEG